MVVEVDVKIEIIGCKRYCKMLWGSMSKIPDEILEKTSTIYIHPAVWESTCKLMEWSKEIKDAGSFFGITVRTDELLAEDQMVLLDRAGRIIHISRFGDLLKGEKNEH